MSQLFRNTAHRVLAVAGLAAAVSAVPAGAAIAQADTASPVAQNCPNSQTQGLYVPECVPGVNPAPADIVPNGPDSLPQLYGIYCTGQNTGTCIGLSRLQTGPDVKPNSTIRHSP